jgi:hypothetical protein
VGRLGDWEPRGKHSSTEKIEESILKMKNIGEIRIELQEYPKKVKQWRTT